MTAAATPEAVRPMDDRVEDDPRLAYLPPTGPTGPTGLTEAEAARRRSLKMGNDTVIRTGRTYFEIFRENALNPVNVLLTAIAAVLVLLGLYGDAVVTLVLVVLNVVVGVYQQGRAKRTLDQLSVLTRPTATILRDGAERVVDQEEAVLGDALVVRLGDQLMLDGRVLSGAMEVDESLLTGEADRIPKHAGDEVYASFFAIAPLREFFELTPLPWTDVLGIGALAAILGDPGDALLAASTG